MSSDQQDDNFFSALFDFSFTTFVTTKIIKVLYLLAIVAIGLWSLFFIVGGLFAGGMRAVGGLFIGLIGFFFGLVYVRVLLELFIVIFRIGEHVAVLADRDAAAPSPPYRAPQPAPPPPTTPSTPGWEPPPQPMARSDEPANRSDEPTTRLPNTPMSAPEQPRPEPRDDEGPRRPGDVPPPPPA